MTVAFVLSGGASLGSVQVGMLRALHDHDVTPDLIVGTSVGAVNGSWLAGGGDVEGLATVWRSLERSDLFPIRPLTGLRGFLGQTNHFVPNSGLRRLLRRHLRFERIEDSSIPFHVVAADAIAGTEVILSEGPALESVMASAALPAVFEPVSINGRPLIDGGVVNNTPITTAIELGATEVWVLSTGYSCALDAPPDSAFAMAMHAVALLVQQRLVLETSERDYPVPVHLIPPPCPITVTPIDFSQTDELIEEATAGTRQWLADGHPPATPMVPHRHGD
ncbi:MAG: patatin-like phospholipase family protein [Acidimicrobiales bacterium]